MAVVYKIIVLYTELAGYTVASLKALKRTSNAEIHLVRWPVNAEAPFAFKLDEEFIVYERNKFSEAELCALADKINPDLVLCSGWNDKGYLAVCKAWFKRIPVVLAMDNKWSGSPKQQVARLIAGFTIRKTFSHCWVPGNQQKNYAMKLGFPEENVKTGFYTCDTGRFDAIYHAQRGSKQLSFPHVFVYAGRYYDFKGVEELWSAFIRFKNESINNWKLVCLGTGDVPPVIHPDIEHRGFVQPESLAAEMAGAGIFILPSRFEPWGVVGQEFAAAGFPLLLSNAVGSTEAFLEEGVNGLSFPANDESAIYSALKRISEMSDVQLLEMGERSHELAMRNNPELWAQTLLSFIVISKS